MTDYNAVAQNLHDLIARDPIWSHMVGQVSLRDHSWYYTFLGRLGFAVGDSPIAFLSSTATFVEGANGPGTFNGQLVAFLDTVYVIATVTHQEDGNDLADIEVAVYSRRPLRGISITGGTRAWGQNNAQPKRPSVRLKYEDETSIDLPLGRAPDATVYADLETLLPSLRADLGA